MSYREKLLSIQVSPRATPSRTLRHYYDSEAVEQVFGDDAHERMMEDTKGVGPVRSQGDGTVATSEGTRMPVEEWLSDIPETEDDSNE